MVVDRLSLTDGTSLRRALRVGGRLEYRSKASLIDVRVLFHPDQNGFGYRNLNYWAGELGVEITRWTDTGGPSINSPTVGAISSRHVSELYTAS